MRRLSFFVGLPCLRLVSAASNATHDLCAFADVRLCEFVCPCCGEQPAANNHLQPGRVTEIFVARPHEAPQSWAAEPGPLDAGAGSSSTWSPPTLMYAVRDDEFHKTVLEQVVQQHNLSTFIDEHFPDNSTDFAAKQDEMSWTDNELAIWLYTIENPQVHVAMNTVLRDATTIIDIDPFWQTYISCLANGLQNHTAYVDATLWRGVLLYGEPVGEVFTLGRAGVLQQFLSTTPSQVVARGFGDVLLQFTGGGYDVRDYSEYPFEGVVLLEPGRQYRVLSMAMPAPGAANSTSGPTVTLGTAGPAAPLRLPPGSGEAAPGGGRASARCPSEPPDICPACDCCAAVASAPGPGRMPSAAETLAAIFGLPALGAVAMVAVYCNPAPRRPLEAREPFLG